MKPVRLLLADNFDAILNSLGKLFERAGYHVTRATSYEEAQRKLELHYFHVAVLDRRLRNDEDETDNSGIDLAKQSDPAIVKIILTQFPTFETARDAMAPGAGGERVAVSYVSKKEPTAVLLDHVARSVASIGIRRDLEIQWQAMDRKVLVKWLLPQGSEADLLEEWSEELEDLVTKLFPAAAEVHFERLLWRDLGRAAMLTRATFPGGSVKFSVVVVGLRESICEEAQQFKSIGSDSSWPGVPLLERSCASIRFAANLFIFGTPDLSHSRPLADVFHHSSDKQFTSTMQHLLTQVLPFWYRMVSPDQKGIGAAYRSHMRVEISSDVFEQAVNAVHDYVAGLGIALEIRQRQLRMWLKGKECVFPDPGHVLINKSGRSTPLCVLPGILDGQNVVVDRQDHTGLTNFNGAGGGPLLAPFIELEAAIRFDWTEEQDFKLLHEIDQLLNQENFSRIQINDADASIRKTLKAVLLIRREAEPLLNDRRAEWWIGTLYAIASRLATQQTPRETAGLARQAHLIMAAGLTAQALINHDQPAVGAIVQRGVTLDDLNHAVMIDGNRITLTPQNFRLLQCLYQHRERVCSPDFLIREALGDSYYDPNDRSQKDRLAMAILRLREKIESNPKQPRFLRAEGGGYKFYPYP